MSRKKKVLIAVGVVVIVLILAGVGGFVWITSGLSKYKNMTIGKVDLTKLPDGTYKGSFKGGRWSNTVEVTVRSHKITSIKVVKDVEFKNPKVADQVFNEVKSAQSTQVDAVTGSTVTSKAYLKSIENALTGKQ